MARQIEVSIDRNSPVPLYHQLSEQLAAAIDTMLEDAAAYASWRAHFGDVPRE